MAAFVPQTPLRYNRYSLHSRMDGSSSAGNTSSASSGLLPTHSDKEVGQHGPESVSLSGSQNDQSLAENQQFPMKSPAGIQRTEEEKLNLNKNTNHRDPLTDKRKPSPRHESKLDPLKPVLLPSEQQLGNTARTEKQNTLTNNLKTEHLSSSIHEANPDKTKLDPLPKQQQKAEDPSKGSLLPKEAHDSNKLKPEQLSPTKPGQPKPDPLCTEQKKPKHEHHPGQSEEHQTQRGLCPTNQKRDEEPPPSMKDLTVLGSIFSKQNQKEQNQLDPALEKFTLSTPERPQDHQDPPHLNTQQTPHHPPKHQLNHQIHPSTMAPPAPPPTIEVFCDQVWPFPPGSSGEPKLCGFLMKQGGPLKAWKQRWFTYEENKNQLFYYRTPQDVTPLGWLELSGATFTYPLRAERGTFHIRTPERTFILKAVTQELMLYWLQQLQVKRWQHRQTSTCPDSTNSSSNTEDFLPVLKSPLGLVGEGAASVSLSQTLFANVSIKHPLIELQNSLHSRKRPSQECQSVFHLEVPHGTPPKSGQTNNTSTLRTPIEPPTPSTPPPSATPAGQVTQTGGRESPSLLDSWSRKTKIRSSFTMPVLRDDSASCERTSRLQQEKQMLMEEVKAQKELVWILHKALEAAQLEKRTCAEFLAEKGEQERLELLRHRERQAVDLRGRLEKAEAEVEALRGSVAQRDAQLSELQEKVTKMIEKNNAKQEVIIKLSDQVSATMSDPRQSGSSSSSGLNSQTFRQFQQEIENLKDDIEAYNTQNKFLNSEIHQLTKLWRNSSEQEKNLMEKCAYLEATHCQVESRYLGVLRKLQETKSLDTAQRDAVQKLIEDALKGELKSVMRVNTTSGHDEYGFKIIPDYEVEDMKLLAKIQALEIRSHNLLHQEGVERPLLSRWAQYLAGRSDDALFASPELKALLRASVPQEYRQRVWRWTVRARTRTIRERHPQRYQQLSEKTRKSPHPASRQIELDLHRTLTTNQHFSSPSCPALQQLRRILLAFSWHSPGIGYCQGLNRLAAIALLILQSEEDAFWCLVAVVETIMPQDYYTKNLLASQVDQRVLKDFLAEKLPRLAAHFENHNIDVSLITFNWFLVVFVESLPSDILLPLWDAFLYEGTKVMFRYALALFKYKEEDFLKIHSSVEIYQYLRFFTKTVTDSRKLTNIAFCDMNPFPGRLIKNRRTFHLERLQAELRELEEQQKEFVTESVQRKDKELDGMVSEDDDDL
ncbi:TBC1 domain family member 2A isoform X2 [Channa argus]